MSSLRRRIEKLEKTESFKIPAMLHISLPAGIDSDAFIKREKEKFIDIHGGLPMYIFVGTESIRKRPPAD